MELFEIRIQRLKNNPPSEFIETILNSFHNYFFRELDVANKESLDLLLILGIHSIIETITENIFLLRGIEGFRFYLENFLDGEKNSLRFSNIAIELNDWRNIIAHQHISRLGHNFIIDYRIKDGYEVKDEKILFNPSIYYKQFKSAFEPSANTKFSIWDYEKLVDEAHMEKAKNKFIEKFSNR